MATDAPAETRLDTETRRLLKLAVSNRRRELLADELEPQGERHRKLPPRRPRVMLTERECEILALVMDGLNNDEIGERLFLSGHTVRSHMKHVLAKLGATNRAHAVAIVLAEAPIQGIEPAATTA